jgi:hypothetical protein
MDLMIWTLLLSKLAFTALAWLVMAPWPTLELLLLRRNDNSRLKMMLGAATELKMCARMHDFNMAGRLLVG